ncbi:MAG: hypothetical protein Solivirus1_12 [Solivirus sp.]|uniref:Uncharacterized protein n=1 Tax=Solivirus sp. TaxID=2487772 RepID=A0A3G5AF62_9VIRU|nr:MAG: hypothetical protein Solivirus1_12 [Solivirus sp.]
MSFHFNFFLFLETKIMAGKIFNRLYNENIYASNFVVNFVEVQQNSLQNSLLNYVA